MAAARTALLLIVCLLLVSPRPLNADARADQKARVQFTGVFGTVVNFFGGKAAREGVTSSTAVKGSRRIRVTDTTGQIIDLTEEKIYDLDIKKKTYKVTTFEELRRRLEEAQTKARENAAKAQAKNEPAQSQNENNVEFDFNVKDTGQTKMINGFDTRESILEVAVHEKGKTIEQSGGLVITSDDWLAPRVAALKEIADFELKYAEKLYGPTVSGASEQEMATAMAMYPMLKPAMARMSAETEKLQGTPIMSTTTMDAAKSAQQLAEEQKQSESSSNSNSSMPKGLGILGGLGKKNGPKDDAGPKPRVTFMTITNEVLKAGTEVSDADVAIPAGFKESK
jgi:hypothetical protein